LGEAGHPVASLSWAAVSHLHQDHAGNLAALGDLPVLVSAAELAPITFTPTDDPALAAVEGAHDLTGDGSLMQLPTPGHSAGSMSLLVRRGDAHPPSSSAT
jgi:glyoxylase-like metal-dependent hydrolase (beta-lactamase superfamily II)